MPFQASEFPGLFPAKALLMAGLCLLGPAGLNGSEPPIPGRQVAPAITPTTMPSATPIPSVRPEELKASEARLKDEIATALKRASDSNAQLEKELSGIREKVQALAIAQGEAGLRLERQSKDALGFSEQLELSQKKLGDGLKKVEEVRLNLEGKGSRMEGLLDLVNTLKRDVNDNSHQIAELKRDIEALKTSSQAPADPEDWWGQLNSWRYLPLVATVISGVAIGMAASSSR
jgi:hypothetical protein